jgi:hypothetical protein
MVEAEAGEGLLGGCAAGADFLPRKLLALALRRLQIGRDHATFTCVQLGLAVERRVASLENAHE